MSIASNTQTQYSSQGVIHGTPGVHTWVTYESAPDKGKTQAAIASNYQTAAENEYNNAIGGLQSLVNSLSGDNANSVVSQATASLMDVYGSLGGTQDALRGYANELGSLHDTISQISDNVNPVFAALTGIGGNLQGISSQLGGNYDAVDRILASLGGIGDTLSPIAQNGADIQDYLTSATENAYRINQFARQAADAAGGITNQVNAVNASADRITNVAEELGGLSPLLQEYGQQMFGTGAGLIDYGQGFLDQAQALMNMDASGGGLVGEYIRSISAIDPNKYVSQAAADVTSAFANQMAQQNRELARSGVDAGSLRSAALQQQLGQAQATATAASKFRARQAGTAERLAAIRGATADANTLAGTGSGLISQGVSAQNSGVNAIAQAANVLSQQGAAVVTGHTLESAFGESYRSLGLLNIRGAYYVRTGQAQSAGERLAAADDFCEYFMETVLDTAQYLNVRVGAVDGLLRCAVETDGTPDPDAIVHKYPAARFSRDGNGVTECILPLEGGGTV